MSPQDAVLETIVRLRSSARRHGGQDADDLVQEALTRAVANGIPLESMPWLQTVTRNIAIDRSRRPREIAHGDAVDLEKFFTDVTAGPEDYMLTAERRQAVRDALAQLPDRYREALLVWADEGAASVSKRLGTSPGATWTLLSRARERLRKELGRVGVLPAMFGFRFRKWWTALAPSGLALGVAVTMTLPSGQPSGAALSPAPVPPRMSVARVEPLNIVASSAPAAHAAAPARVTPVAAVPDLPAPEVRTFQTGACVPQAGSSSPGTANVYLKRTDSESPVSQALVNALPDELKHTEQGSCA